MNPKILHMLRDFVERTDKISRRTEESHYAERKFESQAAKTL
jgi:hypothetical protein